PGDCGCGSPDLDDNGNGVSDCLEQPEDNANGNVNENDNAANDNDNAGNSNTNANSNNNSANVNDNADGEPLTPACGACGAPAMAPIALGLLAIKWRTRPGGRARRVKT